MSPDLIQIFAIWPSWVLAGPSGSRGDSRARSCVSPFHGNKWNSQSVAHLIGCDECYAIIANRGKPQDHSTWSYWYYWEIAAEEGRSRQLTPIYLFIYLYFFLNHRFFPLQIMQQRKLCHCVVTKHPNTKKRVYRLNKFKNLQFKLFTEHSYSWVLKVHCAIITHRVPQCQKYKWL